MNSKQANELRRQAKARHNATKDAEQYAADMEAIDRVFNLAAYQPPLKMTRGVDKVRTIIPRAGEFTIRDIRARYRERFPDDTTTDVVIAAYVSRLKSVGEIEVIRQAHGNQAAKYIVGTATSPAIQALPSISEFIASQLRIHGPQTVQQLAEAARRSGVCTAKQFSNTKGAIVRVVKSQSPRRFTTHRDLIKLKQR